MQTIARIEAQKQWNATACGELEGDKNSVEYFLRVEQDRYRQQGWAPVYFGYNRFAGRKVLEIGVGQGTDLMQFAKAGAQCYGVDITDNHLELTRKNFELRGRQVELKKADATQLPFPDAYFDCVYSFGVLHHIPEIEKVLAEAHRVLKPGGEMMVALYHKWSAFHLAILLRNGLLRGWLFSKGYDGLLATIEKGADGICVKPYVKLYDKREVRRLMAVFQIQDVSVFQLEAGRMGLLLRRCLGGFVARIEPYLGWYIACKARKVAG